MRLDQLTILRAPGLRTRLDLVDLHAGHVLIIGPNASGKSTIGRVMRGMLWPEHAPAKVLAEARWSIEPDDKQVESSLAYGRVDWSEAGIRRPQEVASAWQLSVSELLSTRQQTESPIARQIERALAGGFDLPAARSRFSPPGRYPVKLVREIEQAVDQLRSARADESALAQREQDRERLEERLEASKTANAERLLAQKAVERARALHELETVAEELVALPSALASLRGEVGEEIDRLDEEQRSDATKLTENDRKVEDAKADIQRLKFAGAEPTRESVAQYTETARELRRLEHDLHQAEASYAAARERMATAEREVFAEVPDDVRVGRPVLEKLEQAIERVNIARAKAEATESQLLDHPEPDTGSDPTPIEEGIHALRRWLAEAEPGGAASAGTPGWIAPVVVVLGVIFAAIGWLADQLWALLIGAGGLGAGLSTFVLWLHGKTRQAPEGSHRRTFEAEYQRCGLTPPKRWEPQVVQQRLAELERQLDQARNTERVRELHRGAVQRADNARNVLEEARRQLVHLTDELKLGRDLGGLPLMRIAQRLEALSCAHEVVESEKARHRTLQNNRDEELSELGTWFRTLGFEPPTTGARAEASCNAITERLGDLRNARADLERLDATQKEIVQRRSDREVRIAELNRQAGLEPGQRAELRALLEQLPSFQQLQQRKRDLEGAIHRATSELPEDSRWLDLDVDAALEAMENAAALAEELEERTRAVEELEAAVRAAKRGSDLEQARAALTQAKSELTEAKRAAIEESVGVALVDWLQAAMARDHQPRMLERAQHWFLRFTRGSFRLDVDGDHFIAHDTRLDEARRLDQLSDGTRIQLLLAARLAFMEDAEGDGPKLPLFMDEALSTTDRDRFREVVRCLLELVQDGRQVFYATADRAEVELWRAVCDQEGAEPPQVVDLSSELAEPHWLDGLPLAPAPAPQIPDPTGREAAEYLQELGVSQPGLHDPADSWHLGLLLQDELATLACCLESGIDTVGVWRALRSQQGAPSPIDGESADKLDARVQVLTLTIEQLRVGRGAPVSWEQVEGSGAVTPAFEDDMRSLLLEHGAQPERYVEAVSALPRFRRASKEKLREHLATEGLIDERDVIGPEEIGAAVLRGVTCAVESDTLNLGEVHRLLAWIAEVVTASEQRE